VQWDKADALRDAICAWKTRRRDQELLYLADAVELNQQTQRYHDEIEHARQGVLGERAAAGEALRRTKQELKERSKAQRELERERTEASHQLKQKTKVLLPDQPADAEQDPLQINPVDLFARVFGFGRSAVTPRMISPRAATPRSARSTPRFGATPRDGVRV
jgi:hypothetical protein